MGGCRCKTQISLVAGRLNHATLAMRAHPSALAQNGAAVWARPTAWFRSFSFFEVLRCIRACAVLRDCWCQLYVKASLSLPPESAVCTQVQRTVCVVLRSDHRRGILAHRLDSSRIVPSSSRRVQKGIHSGGPGLVFLESPYPPRRSGKLGVAYRSQAELKPISSSCRFSDESSV